MRKIGLACILNLLQHDVKIINRAERHQNKYICTERSTCMEFLMQRAATRLDFRCTCLHKSLAVLRLDLFGAAIRHSRLPGCCYLFTNACNRRLCRQSVRDCEESGKNKRVVVDPAAAGYSQAARIPPSMNFACKSATRINHQTRASHCSPAKFADALRLNHRAKLHRICAERNGAQPLSFCTSKMCLPTKVFLTQTRARAQTT